MIAGAVDRKAHRPFHPNPRPSTLDPKREHDEMHRKAALLLGITCLLTGCATSSPEPVSSNEARLAGSLTELFEQQLATTDDPVVQDMLRRAIATGEIPQADYDTAHELYARCMSDLGYEMTYERRKNGTQKAIPPLFGTEEDFESYADDSLDCSDQLAVIEALYLTQEGNPGLLSDPTTVVVQCLIHAGLAPSSYRDEDFTNDLEAGADFPFDTNGADAQDCFSRGGFGIETGPE